MIERLKRVFGNLSSYEENPVGYFANQVWHAGVIGGGGGWAAIYYDAMWIIPGRSMCSLRMMNIITM